MILEWVAKEALQVDVRGEVTRTDNTLNFLNSQKFWVINAVVTRNNDGGSQLAYVWLISASSPRKMLP